MCQRKTQSLILQSLLHSTDSPCRQGSSKKQEYLDIPTLQVFNQMYRGTKSWTNPYIYNLGLSCHLHGNKKSMRKAMKLHALLYENRVAHFIYLFVIMVPIQLSFVWSTQFADTPDVIVSISWNMSPWQYPIKLVINHRFWWLNQLCSSFLMVKYHKTIVFAD